MGGPFFGGRVLFVTGFDGGEGIWLVKGEEKVGGAGMVDMEVVGRVSLVVVSKSLG